MSRAKFYLTRHAARALRDIHDFSHRKWGAEIAANYITTIYATIKRAAENPKLGQLRTARAAPFMMIPVREHYIVYDVLHDGIVVLAVLHQRRDIERVIEGLEPSFLADIHALRKKRKMD